ncbi:hypothetical protein [Chitinophaga sp.]|uniref:carboxylesterase family protein n=1 Tax=Chitinophaga sp. TaxID=1869181 RepID=UPI0031D21233
MTQFKNPLAKAATLGLACLLMFSACSRDEGSAEVTPDTGKTEVKPTPTPAPPTAPAENFVNQQTGVTFKKVNGATTVTDYVLQIPASYNEKKTTKWPVIIYLHGVGERGTDLNQVKRSGLAVRAAQEPDFPFIVVSPQCKPNMTWDVAALNILYEDILKQYNIDPSRVYLTGLSMGGYGVWDWAVKFPEKFAAAVPICGAGTPSRACVLKDMPIWAFHNADDYTVGVAGSRNMVNAIKACGGTLVKYTENPTGGHDAWTKAYNDPALYTWLNQQKKQ